MYRPIHGWGSDPEAVASRHYIQQRALYDMFCACLQAPSSTGQALSDTATAELTTSGASNSLSVAHNPQEVPSAQSSPSSRSSSIRQASSQDSLSNPQDDPSAPTSPRSSSNSIQQVPSQTPPTRPDSEETSNAAEAALVSAVAVGSVDIDSASSDSDLLGSEQTGAALGSSELGPGHEDTSSSSDLGSMLDTLLEDASALSSCGDRHSGANIPS